MTARLVYSSDRGRPAACERCGAEPCRCPAVAPLPPERHRVGVRIERAGRGGKTVTSARPFFLATADADGLLRALKHACGGGGTVKADRADDGRPCLRLELQGDHVERVVAWLVERGFAARKSGG